MGASPERRTAWLLAGVLLFALGLRLAFFSALSGYDEFHYAHIARNISLGNFSLPDVTGYYGFRYLLTGPAALFSSLFGFNAAALSLWPLLCSLGSVWVAFLLGRLLYGARAGLLAALLYACLPLSVIYGTMLYPEEVLSFFTGLSVLFFLMAEREVRGRAGLLFLLSGVCCGLAYFARLNAALILGFYAAYGIFYGWRPARLLVFAGLAAALLPEAAFNFLRTGDALFSWHAQQLRLASDAVAFSTNLWVYPRGMLGADLYGLGLFGFFYHLFLGCVLLFIFRKRPEGLGLPLLWFACVFLYLEFGPSHLSGAGYVPAHKQLRFLSMTALPAALFSARCLAEAASRPRYLLLAFMVLTSAAGAMKMRGYQALQAQPYRLACGYVRAADPGSVFVPDAGWRARLDLCFKKPLSAPYYPEGRKNPDGVRELAELDEARLPAAAWVIAPDNWRPKKAAAAVSLGGGHTLYRLGAASRGGGAK